MKPAYPSKRRIGCTGANAIQPANRSVQRFSERPGVGFAQAARSGEIFNPLRKCGYRVVDFATRSRSRSAALRMLRFAENALLHSGCGCDSSQDALSRNVSRVAAPGQKGDWVSLGRPPRYYRCRLRDADQRGRSRRMTMSPHPWPRNPETVSQDFDVRHGAGTRLAPRSRTALGQRR
jgi:hypothetical protein